MKTGYRLCVEFSSPHTEGLKDMIVEKVHIIDDYVEGDYYVYGFFISTEKYEGEEAPINDNNFGFDTYPDIAYTENNINYGLSYRYPFYLEKTYAKSGSLIVNEENSYDMASSKFYDEFIIAKQRNFSIKISDKIERVYVYAVDTSEKRYTLIKEVTKGDNVVKISNAAVFTDVDFYREDYRKPRKIDMTYHINIGFEQAITYASVSEYNRNHEVIHSNIYEKYEDLESSLKIMTEDGVRYVRVSYYLENGNSLQRKTYAVGDYMEITLANKYGFLYTKKARLY